MGRLILWNSISLDGFFEGEKSWDVDWFRPFFGEELQAFSLKQLRSATMLLFGRVTYEGMAAYWKTAQDEVAEYMNTLPKTVFSSTLERADWANSTLVRGDAAAAVRELKRLESGDIFVFGSGKLCATLLEAGLVDEVRLALDPLVLGRGATLFGRGLSRLHMKLLEARPLSNGCVILRYEPLKSMQSK
jgi:dihydrofolate reductase